MDSGSTQLAPSGHRLWREPRRPRSIRESPRAPWFVVGTVCVGAFMGQLDVSIVTIALPRIGAQLHASADLVQWVALSYLLVLAGALPVVGHLADRVGRKLLYTYGFGIFIAGSTLCGFAPSLAWLIIARVVQALGAAMLQANSVALIAESLDSGTLTRGIGLQGAAQAVGLALGPALGGLLLALGGWRLIFFVNIPVGLVGMALGWLLLPRSRSRLAAGRFDHLGAILLFACIGGVLLLVSLTDRLGHTPLLAVGLLALCPGLLSALIIAERHATVPILDLALLRSPGMAGALVGAMTSYMVIFGLLYVIPYYLAAQHTPPLSAGLQLAALPVALGITAALAGHLAGRVGPGRLTFLGLALMCAALLELAVWHQGPGVVLGLALAGCGVGTFTPVNNASIMAHAARWGAGGLSGILNTTRSLGTALGIAFAGLLYAGIAHAGPSLAAAGRGLSLTALAFALLTLCALLLLARSSEVGAPGA